jgi:hypothetical protein
MRYFEIGAFGAEKELKMARRPQKPTRTGTAGAGTGTLCQKKILWRIASLDRVPRRPRKIAGFEDFFPPIRDELTGAKPISKRMKNPRN